MSSSPSSTAQRSAAQRGIAAPSPLAATAAKRRMRLSECGSRASEAPAIARLSLPASYSPSAVQRAAAVRGLGFLEDRQSDDAWLHLAMAQLKDPEHNQVQRTSSLYPGRDNLGVVTSLELFSNAGRLSTAPPAIEYGTEASLNWHYLVTPTLGRASSRGVWSHRLAEHDALWKSM